MKRRRCSFLTLTEGGWGLRETFIDFCVNPLAGADLAGGGVKGGTTGWRDGTWQVNSRCPPRSSTAGGSKCEPTHYLQLCETPSINSVN